MEIKSSLKHKSIYALIAYLCFFLITVGTVSYHVIKSPIYIEIQQNLELRTKLLAIQIEKSLDHSIFLLKSIASLGKASQTQKEQDKVLLTIFGEFDGMVVSGGLWPKPYSIDKHKPYMSLFYYKNSNRKVNDISLWNQSSRDQYDQEAWYKVAENKPSGNIFWSKIYIDTHTNVQMITASMPYYIENQFSGVATIDISLSNLVAFTHNHAENYNLGVILKDNFNEVITKYNFKKIDDIYISKYQFDEFNWSMNIINSKHTVNEEVYELVSKVEFGIIPILLLCVMLGYYLLNHYLIKPIILIAKKVDASKEGGIIDLTYDSKDEIRYLIESFNQKTIFLEAEKIKAQASTKVKSKFLATLSHEIRTPMNGILGTVQILLKSNLNTEQKNYLNTLCDSGEHMIALLNEILDFSKIEQEHLESDKTLFPLESIINSINNVYEALCTKKGLKFQIYSEIPHDRWYFSNKARLRQILFNLLSNAVKFTLNGSIKVYLKERIENGRLHLKIDVQDTGIGISKEAQERVFRPFEQAESSITHRFGGTGLGLAIVRKILELNGGNIILSSKIGVGSNFKVSLKIEKGTPDFKKVSLQKQLHYNGLKALIVEDNLINSIVMKTFMKNKGFHCECADNGQDALGMLHKNHYDFILMDNHMPFMDGVNTINSIRTMKNTKSKVLIFGCTADAFKETFTPMLKAGADFIIVKPIDANKLEEALHHYSEKLYQYSPKHKIRIDS
ncbi:sensor kinase [Candidatus Photodesmus blepharus]|uniref:histidine kinase n=1 Tax=Candidatus Photodesmus blepharonis TaxID=1179155 RepID=A0A084CN43_9GAMM|nr:hybrid sensor histidine kinase/response regulator [Candidatus Photodesmus blepharus]KEY91222.1 sensor kinase [Candidatus Photodesmus blepharus]